MNADRCEQTDSVQEIRMKPGVDGVSKTKASTEAAEEDRVIMVSKAALRCKDMRRTDLPLSEDWKKLLKIYMSEPFPWKKGVDMQTGTG